MAKINEAIKKHTMPFILGIMFLLILASTFTYQYYVETYIGGLYFLAVVVHAILSFASMYLICVQKDFSLKKSIISSTSSAVACGGVALIVLPAIGNNALKLGESNVMFCTLIIVGAYMLALSLTQIALLNKKLLYKLLASFAVTVFSIGSLAYPITIVSILNDNNKAPTVTGFSQYVQKAYEPIENADYYVSTTGNDENDGSKAHPFATIEHAKQVVRSIDKSTKNGITVAIMGGEYKISGLSFDALDGGTPDCPVTYCAYDDREVVLNGGISIKPSDFKAVSDTSTLNRLSENARQNVVCVNLTDYGLTSADWGKIYALGSYSTAYKYDGDYVGDIYCELFYNDTRMTLARYPNSENYLTTNKIVETGQSQEDVNCNKVAGWQELRNPKGDTYGLSKSLAKRIASWQTLDDVWMFGFFKYTWADSSTLIESFNEKKRTLTTKFVSNYGTTNDAPYYFFNVFEELDSPGEWYLDRNSGMLYMYPTSSLSTSTIDLSITTQDIITVQDADYLTFKKLTVKGTRNNAFTIVGNNDTVTLCTIKNVSGYAVSINGYDNMVSENDISHTGKSGITITGGDSQTLTAGNSYAYNNVIHDWSEIYQTYQYAVGLYGVGNVCNHNEIYNSPHEAVTYGGNNHLIEYNNIHDVCLLSDDAGAIYAGRSWIQYGTVIRYNAVYNLGSGSHKPSGIYMDDALSGQTILNNLVINAPHIGIQIGGGRDIIVKGNVVINSATPLSYDDRARNSAINNLEFGDASKEKGGLWTDLYASPWQTEAWQQAYPQYAHFNNDFDDYDNIDFFANPSYSQITGNAFFTLFGMNKCDVSDAANKYSTIDDNHTYNRINLNDFFVDAENGNYNLKSDSKLFEDLPDFQNIPINKIGRE